MEDEVDHSTVKMILNKFCKDKELIGEMNACIKGMTRAGVEATKLLNNYILHFLETRDAALPQPPIARRPSVHKINQTFLYKVWNIILIGSVESTRRVLSVLELACGSATSTKTRRRPVHA